MKGKEIKVRVEPVQFVLREECAFRCKKPSVYAVTNVEDQTCRLVCDDPTCIVMAIIDLFKGYDMWGKRVCG